MRRGVWRRFTAADAGHCVTGGAWWCSVPYVHDGHAVVQYPVLPEKLCAHAVGRVVSLYEVVWHRRHYVALAHGCYSIVLWWHMW